MIKRLVLPNLAGSAQHTIDLVRGTAFDAFHDFRHTEKGRRPHEAELEPDAHDPA